MKWILAFFTLAGFNFAFWAIIGLVRFVSGKVRSWLWRGNYPPLARRVSRRKPDPQDRSCSIIRNEVAALIPAHNEELTIAQTIIAIARNIPAKNIYIGSDASTDRTVAIAQDLGVQVADIRPNRGKAGVLAFLLEHFDILRNYKAVMIVDADSEINPNYMKQALPLFDDPRVAAVAGHAKTKWSPHRWPRWSMFFRAYRARLYRVVQTVVRYGQTAKWSNVTTIAPGFASMYRTSALSRIQINAPGLIIEDYNMTFEVHHKKLGKIAYDAGVYGFTDDPHTFRDYLGQVRRWNLGFWQTVRRHGLWPSWFWLSTGLFLLEMLAFSAFLLALPAALIVFLLNGFDPIALSWPGFWVTPYQLTVLDLVIGVFLTDYLLTVAVAIVEKKPMLLLYGFGFLPLRYLDALLFLYTLPLAFFVRSEGKWVSPQRHFAEPKTAPSGSWEARVVAAPLQGEARKS